MTVEQRLEHIRLASAKLMDAECRADEAVGGGGDWWSRATTLRIQAAVTLVSRRLRALIGSRACVRRHMRMRVCLALTADCRSVRNARLLTMS